MMSNNNSSGKCLVASVGAQALLVQQSMQSYISEMIELASFNRRILHVIVHLTPHYNRTG